MMHVAEHYTMSPGDFRKLSLHIEQRYGIQLPITKKNMVESRLQKRLKHLQCTSFRTYFEFVFSEKGRSTEYLQMLDLITTNKTNFFREKMHFEFLRDEILPKLWNLKSSSNPLKIWSAACSSGEEVYSIGITIESFASTQGNVPYQLLGTDLSTRMLSQALSAVYPLSTVDELSQSLKRKYFLKSKDPQQPKVRIIKEIRNKAVFRRLNLLEETHQVKQQFDVIFCRNVLIYFNKTNQKIVLNQLIDHIAPRGYLLIGHSESLTGLNLPVQQIKPTIYQKI
ncbi:MAG: CheR family methyltransferase [Cyclobacteriaceae bacterium]